MKLLALLVLMGCSFPTPALLAQQAGSYRVEAKTWNPAIPERPRLRRIVDSLAQDWSLRDREALYALNLARTEPRVFMDSLLKPYLAFQPGVRGSYSASLEKTLASMKPVQALVPGKIVKRLADEHAADLAKLRDISHNSSDGTSGVVRFQRAGLLCASECINVSQDAPGVEVVISLLLDINVPNLGHRKSLLDPQYERVGIRSVQNKRDWTVSVFVLGCEP